MTDPHELPPTLSGNIHEIAKSVEGRLSEDLTSLRQEMQRTRDTLRQLAVFVIVLIWIVGAWGLAWAYVTFAR